MRVEVSLRIELPASGDINGVEPVVVEAGRRAMVDTIGAACREYERAVVACPSCASEALQSDGTDERVLLCSFGRVELSLRRLRCEGCGRRFRPAEPFLGSLGGANVTAKLEQACVLAGESWPYVTAARVLHELCGAQVSPEWVRRLTQRAGTAEAQRQLAEAEEVVQPTAEAVRTACTQAQTSDARERREPELLMVGLDGGWVASREQAGGMEGKVGVVATEAVPMGRGRRRLCRRRYTATFGPSSHLGALTYAAASALDGEHARAQVVLGDGAHWIKTEAELHFPAAVKVLDWPHLSRAVQRAIRAARPGRRRRSERRVLHQELTEYLWRGNVEQALARLTALQPPTDAEPIPALETAIRYLEEQQDWLGDYQAWRDAAYPIGSGLVERAIELVINRRLRRRGMRWKRENAHALVALRTHTLNADWDHANCSRSAA